ncbi:universal stress protein [Umezawaea sp.]|uniref:universal stress protein n=1 Tax=Umezawaea sp. TaxID=1955258 RepID=UPI002ED06CDA
MTRTGNSVVVGVDGSASSMGAVRWGALECARQGGSVLRLVHAYLMPAKVAPTVLAVGSRIPGAIEAQGRRWLAEARAAAGDAAPDVTVETELVLGAAVPVLARESEGAGMIVLGSRGLGGFARLLAGSTALGTSTCAECPVVVVRGESTEDGPIVVGVDGSVAGEAAAGFAFEAAAAQGAPLVAVIAWTDYLEPALHGRTWPRAEWSRVEEAELRVLDQSLARWREKFPDVRVERVVTEDPPVRSLLHQARKARLLVVGSRGHGALAGMLLGSTSQALAHHSPCPLAVVRPR